jgi:tyrosinase
MSAKNLLKLMQRPLEPSYLPKEGSVFKLPEKYYVDKRDAEKKVESRLEQDEIDVLEKSIPDFSFTNEIPLKGAFCLFIEKHQEIAGRLTKLFMDLPDIPTLQSVGIYIRDRINPYLYQYSLAVALNHRKDTNHLSTPLVIQTFPDQFLDPSLLPNLKIESRFTEEDRKVVEIPRNYTASDDEPEQKMAYFREDIAVNSQ